MGNEENIRVEVNLYSVSQALEFLKRLNVNISDTWLRKRMDSAELKIYHVGKTDFVTETDLYRLYLLPTSKPGPKPKRQRRK